MIKNIFFAVKKWIRIFRSYFKDNNDNKDNIYDNLIPKNKSKFNFENQDKEILKNYVPGKKNIIIIDDSPGIISIVVDMLEELHSNKKINLHEYNILKFYGKFAPFLLEYTLEKNNITKIDYAIIDIILPGRLKIDGIQKRLDGIDTAILLNKQYNCNNFVFYTGNVVSEYIDFIKEKVDRFYDFFGIHIKEQIIFKGEGDDAKFKFEDLLLNKYDINRF